MNSNLIIETTNEVVSLEQTTVEAYRKLHAQSVVSSRYVSITAEERAANAQTHFMIGSVGALGVAVANRLFQMFNAEDAALAL